MKTPRVAVLGTGMAGFGAAHHLHSAGIRATLYDKNPYHGGNTASFRYDNGFLFDVGPHITYSKDPRIQDLLADSVDQKFETLQVALNNYWQGYWPLHPAQVHLHGLPTDVIVKVIEDFVDERNAPEREIRNYADWLYASFGRAFAQNFPMKYTRKFHTTTAENMSTDWLGPRVYRPNLSEVLKGSLSADYEHQHYVSHFRYPSEGGFARYFTKFLPKAEIKLNYEVVAIDPRERTITFANGSVTQYDALVSSVPLPDLIAMVKGVPDDVAAAARRLACSTCVLVNVGINRPDISKAHMTYFYDEDICFTRLGFPHMLSPKNARPGTGSIQAEVYFSDKYKPLEGKREDWIEPVLRDLRRCGLIREDDTILFKNATLIRYANVIFDLERAAALKTVHAYLDEIGIAYCGRYGEWGYHWTDESFKSGEKAAEHSLAALALSR